MYLVNKTFRVRLWQTGHHGVCDCEVVIYIYCFVQIATSCAARRGRSSQNGGEEVVEPFMQGFVSNKIQSLQAERKQKLRSLKVNFIFIIELLSSKLIPLIG